MWVTETRFSRNESLAKKVRVRQTVRSSARGLEAEPVSCLYRQSDSAIVVMKSEVAGAWPEVGWNEAARQW